MGLTYTTQSVPRDVTYGLLTHHVEATAIDSAVITLMEPSVRDVNKVLSPKLKNIPENDQTFFISR